MILLSKLCAQHVVVKMRQCNTRFPINCVENVNIEAGVFVRHKILDSLPLESGRLDYDELVEQGLI